MKKSDIEANPIEGRPAETVPARRYTRRATLPDVEAIRYTPGDAALDLRYNIRMVEPAHVHLLRLDSGREEVLYIGDYIVFGEGGISVVPGPDFERDYVPAFGG